MKVVVTRCAEEKLEKIYDYGFVNFGLRAVTGLQEGLEEKLWLLRSHPFIGTPERLLGKSPLGYRYLVTLGIFKLIYYVDVENNSVIISDLWDVRKEPSFLAAQTQCVDNQKIILYNHHYAQAQADAAWRAPLPAARHRRSA